MEGQSATRSHKVKNKKPTTKTKTPKKKTKTEGPTCSMFLADLTRKLVQKKKHEADVEMTKNIIDTIIDTLSNSLPVIVSKKSCEKPDQQSKETNQPISINQLQAMAPELQPRDTIEVPNLPKFDERDTKHTIVNEVSEVVIFGGKPSTPGFKMPKMPLVSSDVIKPKPRIFGSMHDMAVNTGGEHDVASEIAKHVSTLKKISLIAEEFNQKTAKSLKEIVDSVQQDLIQKLEEVKAEEKKRAAAAITLAAAAEAETAEAMAKVAEEEPDLAEDDIVSNYT